jgi:hypothetical protein
VALFSAATDFHESSKPGKMLVDGFLPTRVPRCRIEQKTKISKFPMGRSTQLCALCQKKRTRDSEAPEKHGWAVSLTVGVVAARLAPEGMTTQAKTDASGPRRTIRSYILMRWSTGRSRRLAMQVALSIALTIGLSAPTAAPSIPQARPFYCHRASIAIEGTLLCPRFRGKRPDRKFRGSQFRKKYDFEIF